jgi:hypothetical protein
MTSPRPQPTGDGKATTTRSRFRLSIAVANCIEAPAARVWTLLTDLKAQARWNSTLVSIEGTVARGGRVTFAVPEAPRQTFSPTIVRYDEGRSMVWRVSVGPLLVSERTYRLTPLPDGSTEFSVDEVFRGPALPLVVRTFPDFGRMFERTAADLKAEAEKLPDAETTVDHETPAGAGTAGAPEGPATA